MIIIPQSSQYHHYHHGKHNYRHQACSLSLRVKVWAAHVKIPFFFLHHRCTVSKGAIPPPLQSPTPQKPKLPPTHGNFWGPAAILQDFSGPTGANKGPKDRPPLSNRCAPDTHLKCIVLWFYELSGEGGPPPESLSWTDVPLDRPSHLDINNSIHRTHRTIILDNQSPSPGQNSRKRWQVADL